MDVGPEVPEPGDVDAFYREHYGRVLGGGLAGSSLAKTHVRLETPFPPAMRLRRVLEPGAGQGEHFSFVRHGFDEYVELDMRPRHRADVEDARRTAVVGDAQDLPFDDDSFDRVVATCLLLHLPDPETALSEWRRVVQPRGFVSLHVPCEPGLAVRAARRFITVPRVRRSGYEGYALFNARDHRNHVASIDQMIRHVFRRDELHVWQYPFGVPSWNLNAFFTYQIRLAS